MGNVLSDAGESLKKKRDQFAENNPGAAKVGEAVYDYAGGGASQKMAQGIGQSLGVLDGGGPKQHNPEQYQFSPEAQAQRARAQEASVSRQAMLNRALASVGGRDTSQGMSPAMMARLGQAAAGVGGPSAAQSQLQSATDQGIRQSMAMAASGRGNPALAQQAAGQQQAQMSQQAAQASASLRAREQQSAQQMQIGAEQTNLQAMLAQQNQQDAMTQYYQSGIDAQIAGRTRDDLGYEGILAGQHGQTQSLLSQQAQAAQAAQAQKQAGYMGAATTVGAAAYT